MNTEIDTAIKTIAKKLNDVSDRDDALKYSQAVLNLAHAQVTLNIDERAEKDNQEN